MVGHVEEAATAPVRRVVLLGASNVTLGLSTAVATAQHAWGLPLEVLAAIGHGRSYGVASNFLGRTLPGIVECGLWQELETRPHLPTAALVTDIGNDIVYGSDVRPILQWVETCLERLAVQVDRLVVTRLPLESISAAAAWKVRLLSSLIFPGSRLNHEDALTKAMELDHKLLEYANRYGAYVVQPDPTWYMWDPIHVSRAHRIAAWQAYMSCWSHGQLPTPATPSLRRWSALFRARPYTWKLLGIEKHRVQPSVRLRDGTAIFLF